MEMNKNDESLIIPPELAVRAMRDAGFRNTAYALAELIDNSIQAEAKNVELVCVQQRQLIKEKKLNRITSIAVIDNGEGMPPEVLKLALQFGNGTRFDRKGMGRFGMGLPNSSISQCRRVEVWTWQNGPDNAFYTYLDVDEIEKRLLYTVPEPSVKPIPQEWRKRSGIIGTSGTLVLWTKFDEHRLSWRGARATLEHTETITGRMYRKFIDAGRVVIRLLALELEDKEEIKSLDQRVRVNDPLYLMKNSSTPPPFDKEPMFQKWGEDDNDEEFEIEIEGKKHKVVVRMSYAKPETVPDEPGVDRGSQPYGKHAVKNRGISIVREGRELDLDPSWAIHYIPTERWWGIEVEFDAELDEIFGVTNNKQSATKFSQMAQFDWKGEAEEKEKQSEFLKRIQDEGDPRAFLFPITDHIQKQLALIREELKKQTAGRRPTAKRYDTPSNADVATKKFEKRAEQGHRTKQDDQEFNKKDRDELEEDLKENYPDKVAKEIADATLKRKRRVVFLTKAMDGYAFFNIEHQHGGLTKVIFNTNHPFHEKIIEILKPEIGDETDADLLARIHSATDTLELLFAAWARYEMEERDKKGDLFDMRQEWGKMARFFLDSGE